MAEEKAAKTEAKKAVEKAQAKPEEKAIKEPLKAAPGIAEPPKTDVKVVSEAAKATPEVQVKPETPKAEAKKEADPGKEFVDGVMAEMNLKGASKKRLVKMLAEEYGFDKQKVLFKLRRALITERYAAAHAEAGH